jgi:hypothetical protein
MAHIFFIVLLLAFFYSGEVILFMVTAGRKRPRWNLDGTKKSPESRDFGNLLAEASLWIGVLFWGSVFFFVLVPLLLRYAK